MSIIPVYYPSVPQPAFFMCSNIHADGQNRDTTCKTTFLSHGGRVPYILSRPGEVDAELRPADGGVLWDPGALGQELGQTGTANTRWGPCRKTWTTRHLPPPHIMYVNFLSEGLAGLALKLQVALGGRLIARRSRFTPKNGFAWYLVD